MDAADFGPVFKRSKTDDCLLPLVFTVTMAMAFFDPNPLNGDDVISMAMTLSDGRYEFNRIDAGSYFVLQAAQTASGVTLQRSVSSLITINSEDVRGQITELINSFDQTAQLVRDESQNDNPETSSEPVVEAIGGERDLLADLASALGAVQISVDSATLPDLISVRLDDTAQGERRIIWDGADDTDAVTVDDTGLGGVDLTTDAEGIQFQVRADLAETDAVIRIYTNDGNAGTANRFSTATIDVPVTTGSFLSAEFLPFSQFVDAPGGGADFANVGAIELEITSPPDADVTGDLIGAVGTTPFTVDFNNFETADLSLEISVDDSTPNVGQTVDYTVVLRNNGPENATNVSVRELLPSGVTFVSVDPSRGNYELANGLWTLSTLASGSGCHLIPANQQLCNYVLKSMQSMWIPTYRR